MAVELRLPGRGTLRSVPDLDRPCVRDAERDAVAQVESPVQVALPGIGEFRSGSSTIDEGGDPVQGIAYLSWPARK